MKKGWILLLSLFGITLLISLTIYFFFYFGNCKDLECFNKNLASCTKSTYLNKGEWTYHYRIKGLENGECLIEVKLVFAGLEPKFDKLLDKKMQCLIPLRKIDPPESDLSYCSGPLKEEIQYLLIKDLYQYTSQNLGKPDE